jgi:prepilin-type N-terminal cleavage/methylation domain-containing protein
MRKGFTFIELLVVVAIGAIMAALLIPALSKARTAAAGATCVDNVHKIGLAISSWRNDHDGAWFVIPDSPGDGYWSDQRRACQVIAFLMESYLEDLNTLVCPNLDSPHPRKPELRMREDHNLDVSKCHYLRGL